MAVTAEQAALAGWERQAVTEQQVFGSTNPKRLPAQRQCRSVLGQQLAH